MGIILIFIGLAWLVWAELTWMIAPLALASEAPYRHVKDREKIVEKDLFDLSYGIAKEFRNTNPHPLGASIPLILGLLLFQNARSKISKPKAEQIDSPKGRSAPW